MPDISPFRGVRYDLGHVGSLSDVVCPPYDVISPEFQEQLYKKHPANFVRLELNRQEPGDGDANEKYARAAKLLKNWRQEGVLFADTQPAVYVYHQTFDYAGRTHTRRGFMCRVKLERFGEGRIYPHEETLSGPKQDRLLLTRACKANLSQIFGLFPDPSNEAQDLVERAAAGVPAVEAVDHLGVRHRMWTVADSETLLKLQQAMGPKPVFIADGHHRYETACNYRDELAAAAGGSLPAGHPANYVLMQCVGMNDPGLLVLPTHRLFRGLPPMTSDQFVAKLGDCFTTRLAGEGPDLAGRVWGEIEKDNQQGTIGFFTNVEKRWMVARVTPAGRARMAAIAGEHSEPWRELGVALLHRLVVETLLEGRDLPKPKYVHAVDEVVESLESGDVGGRDATGVVSQGGDFELSALVMPATVDHVRVISEHAERMPAKSTYFYPKLLGGMVVNPLE